jgi:hypothetical protein
MFSSAFGHWHTNMAKLVMPILCPNPTPMHRLSLPYGTQSQQMVKTMVRNNTSLGFSFDL